MVTYIKCVGFLLACLLLGLISLALTPFLIAIGVGMLVMFAGFILYEARKIDIDAEVGKLKEERKGNKNESKM
ncbi:hypothetical protein pVco7_gp107 [Vibrio phage pVco-7]